jgi:hypothetical protein
MAQASITRGMSANRGEARIPKAAADAIRGAARALNIAWVEDALSGPASVICPRSTRCPRTDYCNGADTSRARDHGCARGDHRQGEAGDDRAQIEAEVALTSLLGRTDAADRQYADDSSSEVIVRGLAFHVMDERGSCSSTIAVRVRVFLTRSPKPDPSLRRDSLQGREVSNLRRCLFSAGPLYACDPS